MTENEIREHFGNARAAFKKLRNLLEKYLERGESFPDPIGFVEWPPALKSQLIQEAVSARSTVVSELQAIEALDD